MAYLFSSPDNTELVLFNDTTVRDFHRCKTDRFLRISISEATNTDVAYSQFRLAKKVKGLKQNPLKQGFTHCFSR